MRLPKISPVVLAAVVAILAGVVFAVAVPLQADSGNVLWKRVAIGVAIGLVVLVVVAGRPPSRRRPTDRDDSPSA